VSQQASSAFVVSEPSEIVQALVGLKDVRVLRYARRGPEVELVVEQVVDERTSAGPLRGSAGLRDADAAGVAKWATAQVGTGRTLSEVAAELDCDCTRSMTR
jgi:hypothetical protein